MVEHVRVLGGEFLTYGEWRQEYNAIPDDSQNPKLSDLLDAWSLSKSAFEALSSWSEREDDLLGLKLRAGNVVADTLEIIETNEKNKGVIYAVAATAMWMVKTEDYQQKFLGLDISGGLLALHGEGIILPSGVRSYLGNIPQNDVPDLVQRGVRVADIIRRWRTDGADESFMKWAKGVTAGPVIRS